MPKLNLEPNLTDPDAFYEALTDVHRRCTPETSERINARLVLLLANHVGDVEMLREAIEIAAASDRRVTATDARTAETHEGSR